jgi:hypothetical protein
MTKTTGLSANTQDRLVLDAGAVYLNYGIVGQERLLGATRGGSVFNLGRTIRVMEADGTIGQLKGMRRRESVVPVITANMLEMTVQNLLDAIAGAVGTDGGSTVTIAGGEVADADYFTNVAIVATLSGSDTPVICIVKNALADAGFSLTTADRNEAVSEITFTGHFDPATPRTEPWEIIWPDDGTMGSGS